MERVDEAKMLSVVAAGRKVCARVMLAILALWRAEPHGEYAELVADIDLACHNRAAREHLHARIAELGKYTRPWNHLTWHVGLDIADIDEL